MFIKETTKQDKELPYFLYEFYHMFSEQFPTQMLSKHLMFENKLNYKCIVEAALSFWALLQHKKATGLIVDKMDLITTFPNLMYCS